MKQEQKLCYYKCMSFIYGFMARETYFSYVASDFDYTRTLHWSLHSKRNYKNLEKEFHILNPSIYVQLRSTRFPVLQLNRLLRWNKLRKFFVEIFHGSNCNSSKIVATELYLE